MKDETREDRWLPVTAEVGSEGGDAAAAAAEGEQVRDDGSVGKHATEPAERSKQ